MEVLLYPGLYRLYGNNKILYPPMVQLLSGKREINKWTFSVAYQWSGFSSTVFQIKFRSVGALCSIYPTMCGFRKNPYSPDGRSLEIPSGRGS